MCGRTFLKHVMFFIEQIDFSINNILYFWGFIWKKTISYILHVWISYVDWLYSQDESRDYVFIFVVYLINNTSITMYVLMARGLFKSDCEWCFYLHSFSFITATMTKIIKEMLPPDVRVARDAQDLLIECCVGKRIIGKCHFIVAPVVVTYCVSSILYTIRYLALFCVTYKVLVLLFIYLL